MFNESQIDTGLVSFGIFILAFVIFNVLEAQLPRRAENKDMAFRWANNIILTIIAFMVTKVSQLSFTWLVADNHIGLLQILDINFFVGFVIAFISFELADYFIHRLMHNVPILWRLHTVHHSDTEFDVSLTYRNHPLATVFLTFFRLFVLLLLGAPLEVVMAYEMIRMLLDTFSHSNIRLPVKLDKALRYFIVTPDFHRIHHSSNKFYTNSNYSTTIPWFDYLFKTHRNIPYDDHPNIEIGLEYFREKKDSRVDQLLLMPFKKFEFVARNNNNNNQRNKS